MAVSSTFPVKTRHPDASLDGKVVLPGDERFDQARRAWNLAVDQRPAAVVFPESAADVAAVVGYAAGRGLRVAAQGTGHNAGPLGPLTDTVLLRTEKMRGIRIDPQARTARVQAGVVWLDVVQAVARHGLAALAGSSPDVGVVGYTLGGGLSFLGRKYGLAASNVRAIDVVTADGRLVRADRDQLPSEAIDAFIQAVGPGAAFPLLSAELRHLGGELGRARPGHGSLAAIDAQYVLYAVGMTPVPELVDTVTAQVETVKGTLAPWAAKQMYLNFAETQHPAAPFWTEQAYQRLRRIKADVDPGNLIRSNHPIPPAR